MTSAERSIGISILILTLDEEINIAQCIDSVGWSDDVVILDSFSSDNTAVIAEQKGARVFQREFDNYASQRNFGIGDIDYKHEWLLMVDADEIVTESLAEEIRQVLLNGDTDITLYRMRRKDYFLGKWIRRSSGYPTWFGRLMKIGRVSVEREINEEYVTDGEVGLLDNHLHHYPFNKGFSWWVARHNRYSTMEAQNMFDKRALSESIRWSDLVSFDPTLRRKAIKQIVYRMPGRPLLMFLALYFVRGGVLEGRAGFTFCMLKAFYEFLISCKYRELEIRSRGHNL